MRRREFIGGLATVVWPSAAFAQQRLATIGYLSISGPETAITFTNAFKQGLNDADFVERKNVAVEYRFAAGRFDRLPTLAADLVQLRVDVIIAQGAPAAIAAKAATATIPVVFYLGEDPVKEGLVASLNRPGGNATGFSDFGNQMMAKRLELLHQAVPRATAMGFFVNPVNPNADPDTKDAQTAAFALGLALRVLPAAAERDFAQAFATIARERIDALLLGVDPFYWTHSDQLVALAAKYAVPTLYDRSIFPTAGGMMSYGPNTAEADRQTGVYVGRILKGAKPADLPVIRSTKFEFVINLRIANALGLTIPETLLATADEVIQ
jgi:putative tryptophan/tyrosine transport system substrate-binding protein